MTVVHRLRARALDLLGAGPRSGWRTRSDPVRGRGAALRAEGAYWEHWLATKGGRWPEEYAFRFDADAEVSDPALREVLRELPGEEVSILDVGAGPASMVGCRYPGKRLTVVAVDPLAATYARLLAAAGVEPPVRTSSLEGERLVEGLGRDRFDIAYARNALDHAVDPVLIVEQMLDVVRPGGSVVLRHVRNEGERQGYGQLHQWNFDERDGELVVWRGGSETRVGEALAGRGTLTCRAEPDPEGGPPSIVCRIRKTPFILAG
jgi:SAM-dependent methyltransferase